MWLFLISLLATEGVQSASIGYPYSSFLTYSPQKSASVHGYLQYLDNYGAGILVGYNNLQPVYAVRQIKYINTAEPTLEATATKNSAEIIKARETYLRAASLQQYQNLKSDIDALKAQGKEPSPEKLSKLQMLEKIAFTSDFSLIAELPEVKATLHDLESSISGLYREPVQPSLIPSTDIKQSIGEIKTYVGNTNIPAVAIAETPEQKQARENHLRIYNEQIAHLKQLELEHEKYLKESSLKSNAAQLPNEVKLLVEKVDNSKALAELKQAEQEHFRLWNEAKLRAEEAGYESGEKSVQKTADQQQISEIKIGQSIFKPKQTIPSIQNSANQQLSTQFGDQNVKSSTSNLQHKHQLSEQGRVLNEKMHISEQHQVADTPEVVRAREEHLRIVNEAILKSQQEQSQQHILNSNSKDEKAQISFQSQKNISPALNYRAEQSVVEETAEVKKAREEHLRLVQEANQRAQFVEQQESKYKHDSQVPILKSQYEQQNQPTLQSQIAEVGKAHAEHLRLVNDAQFTPQQQLSETQLSGETPEVQRAREEHLRIFNSIKAHTEHEQAKQSSRSFPHPKSDQKPILDFAMEEERVLELERLREAERLHKEHQLLELERLREAERLAEEKRQMNAELMRLRLEEEQRLEMERLLEEKRLQQEQEQLKTYQSGEYQEIIIQDESPDKQEDILVIPSTVVEQARNQQNIEIAYQQNPQFANNPFLKVGQISSATANHLEQSINQQSSPLKTIPVQLPSNSVTSSSHLTSRDNTAPNIRYIQSSQHSSGSKHQYIKDDKVKHNLHDSAGYQPADTASVLIALEKATNDHFRAHELALEQLRVARIKNPSVKDCN